MRIKIEWEEVHPTGNATIKLWWLGRITGEKSCVVVTPFQSGWMWQYSQHQQAGFDTAEQAMQNSQQWFTDQEPPLP